MTDANVATGRRSWVLLALMLSMMLAAIDTTIVATAMPQIVADLGDFALFTWVFSIYLLTQTVTIPIYGKLSDIYGRKPVLMIGSAVFLAGSAASAGAWSMLSLIVFRGLQGLGAGSVMATVNTLAGDLYTVRERARVQGYLASVWGISAILGPTLGGLFAEYVSWRWIFWVNLPVGLVTMGLLWLFLHESVARTRHAVDYLGSLVILLAVGLLIFGLLQGGVAWAWSSWPSLAVFGVALGFTGLSIWSQRRAAEPIMPGWLLRNRGLVGVNLAMVTMGMAIMGPSAYLPTFAQAVLGLGAIAAGLVLAAMSIGWPTASALSGRIYLRIGFRDTALIGAAVLSLGAAGFMLLPRDMPVWLLVVDQMMLGVGFGLLSTATLVGAQASVDWQERGVVTGANMFARFLGQSFGVALFGAIFNATMQARLHSVPNSLRERMPTRVDDVMTVLKNDSLGPQGRAYLQQAIHDATWHLYIGLLVVAIVSALLLWVVPRDFGGDESS